MTMHCAKVLTFQI